MLTISTPCRATVKVQLWCIAIGDRIPYRTEPFFSSMEKPSSDKGSVIPKASGDMLGWGASSGDVERFANAALRLVELS